MTTTYSLPYRILQETIILTGIGTPNPGYIAHEKTLTSIQIEQTRKALEIARRDSTKIYDFYQNEDRLNRLRSRHKLLRDILAQT